MKNLIISIFLTVSFIIITSSCEKFLDKAPEASFTEEEVFANYENFKKYFDGIYDGTYPSANFNLQNAFDWFFTRGPRAFSMDQCTELADRTNIRENHMIKSGVMGSIINFFIDDPVQRPILGAMFRCIRIVNTTLQKVSLLKNVDQEEIDFIIAQAYFLRAFCHFTLFKFWGPMPYINNVIGAYDDWDLPRLSKHETCMYIAADLDTAIIYYQKANRMRIDNPVVGGVGHLNHPDMFRPNGVAAKALKGRVLLYAASPQNNELGQKDWEEAAKANWEAIQIAEQNGYFLMNANDYKLNFTGTQYCDEHLWAHSLGSATYSNAYMAQWTNSVYKGVNAPCGCPSQNAVDMFETKWGDPLNTQADRDAATALGHYNEQDPYVNRDPRFAINITYNGAPIPGFITADIYYEDTPDGIVYSTLLDKKFLYLTTTGYYKRKRWAGQSVKNNISALITDAIIRLGELYLNYAEAANEAYGPNTPAPGATLTAVQAINVIRQRIGQADVQDQFTTSKEIFRSKIKNERTVELMQEGHHYFDIRRWLDAPSIMSTPMMGISIEKVPVSPDYPIGFKHVRIPLPGTIQVAWKSHMYYWPFKTEDYYKMVNFDVSINPPW